MSKAPASPYTIVEQPEYPLRPWAVRSTISLAILITFKTRNAAKAWIADRELMARAFGPKK